MDRLGKIAISIWTVLLVGGALFIGLLTWGTTFMGDMIYPLEIQNNGLTEIKIKTYKLVYFGADKKLTVDSLILKPKDKLDIGTSHSCSRIDTAYIDLQAIEIFDYNGKSRVFKRKDIVDYLTKKEKVGCATYLIQ